MSENGIIGNNGDLPWHLSADLQHFKSITMDKPIVMGRLTHESIGRPLPGRENIILTRNKSYRAEGCRVIHDLSELDSSADSTEMMIIGGAQLYAETLSIADRLYLTEVHAEVKGDTSFPDFIRADWHEVQRESFKADEKNEYDYSFVVYDRA